MKKTGWFLILIFGVTAAYAQTLNRAIESAAGEISGKLPERSTVAVISFQSNSENSERLTNYVIDELNGKIANIGKLSPIERRQLNTIREELNFNMSGEVSDASAQRIGRMLGSQYVIMGSIDTVGSQYRIRFRAITTETAAIEYSFSRNIRNDTVLESLLGGTGVLADFSPQERLLASTLNLFFGVGSFAVQKDNGGGAGIASLEAVGVLFVILGVAMSYDEPELGSAFGVIGGLTWLGGAIYGIVRPQTYKKPGSIAFSPFDGFQLDLVSLDKKNTGLQISYKWEF
jgi:TolB-like protein